MTRILIVDDKEENLRYLEALLGKHAFSVDSARNGAEALIKAQQSPPQLVISDLLMPVMDGYTLLRHWKADAAFKHIPFMVYTATFTDVDDRHFGENLGADAYLLKPAKIAEFLGCVREVLAKAAAVAPSAPLASSLEGDDQTTLKYYSERLIRKLEEKTVQLEQTNQALQREITEHQQADERLRFNNAILQTQQHNSLDGILVVSVAGHVLSFNDRFLALWDVAADLMDACRETPLLHSAPVLAVIGRALENPSAYLTKVRYLHEHGTETSFDEVRLKDGRLLEVYSAPAIGPDAQHYGRIWYYRDVTENRTAKASLEASLLEQRQLRELLEIEHAQLEGLLESLREKAVQLSNAQRIGRMGSWSSDARSGRLIWTDATCELFGIRPEEFDGTFAHFRSLIHPDDLTGFDAAYARVSLDNPLIDMEYRVLHPDGGVRWLYARGNVEFDATGVAISRAGMVMDITDQREASEQLAKNTALLRIAGRLSKMGGWSVEVKRGKVNWSDEVCLLHDVPAGYSPTLEEGFGFYSDDSREVIAGAYTRCETHGVPFDIESEIITARGRRICVRVIGEALGSSEKGTLQIQGAIMDVSERKAAEEQIHGLGNRLVETLESISDGFFTVDHNWNFVYVNGRAERLVRRSRVELLGRNFWDEFKEVIGTPIEYNYRRVMAERESISFEEFYPPLNSWFEVSAYPANTGLAVYFRDVTRRKETEAQLAYLHRVRAVLGGINALIARARNREELFREACKVAYQAGEFRMAMLCMIDPVTQSIAPVASEGKDDALMAIIRSTLASADTAAKTMVVHALRTQQPVVANESVRDKRVLFGEQYRASGVQSMAVLPLTIHGKALGVLALYAREIGFFQQDEMSLLTEMAGDIAFAIDRIEKQERLDYLANFDTLTGLANRALFLARLGERMHTAAGTGAKLCVALTNLARFKNINDTLGRGNGDLLLRAFAEWLIRNTGHANQLARLGADEFAVVFTIRQGGDLIKLFDSLSRTLEANHFSVGDTTLRISARSGIAVYPADGMDADTLLRNAEAALKEARLTNERFKFYTREMNIAVASRLTLENQLRQAVGNEEFELYYQPKANLLSGRITGAEALIRWNNPRDGLVLPGKFIPVLEETGMIADVGQWALRTAIADFSRWQRSGLPAVRVAVNVSPLQLSNRKFIIDLEHNSGLDARAAAGLELEITESVIMDDIQANTATLHAIRAMGIKIAIDDFGTGFSSLGYLAKLPVDALKIDRSFVVDMTASPEGLALVSTIIGLAHALNLKVVAEGVETDEQMRLLRLLKCDEIQGYALSRPIPVAEFERKFLRDDFKLTI